MDDALSQFARLFTDLDGFLTAFVADRGGWIHALLFVIVFCETGLVVTPFLPGDSLLFAVGAISARTLSGPTAPSVELLNLPLAMGVMFIAAVLGDALNYQVGRVVGPPAFSGKYRWLKRQHLERTHAFFERHGGKAVVIARFVPIVRTFAPFVAGIGTMRYRTFAFYNITGAALWVGLLCSAGRIFGEMPFVKANFSMVVLGIIIVSVLPIAIEAIRARNRRSAPVE
ncbi:MAG: DedA family protein [Phycisphaerales bacterium]|nr:DedA family protein [Phycisphaerales bacterium]